MNQSVRFWSLFALSLAACSSAPGNDAGSAPDTGSSLRQSDDVNPRSDTPSPPGDAVSSDGDTLADAVAFDAPLDDHGSAMSPDVPSSDVPSREGVDVVEQRPDLAPAIDVVDAGLVLCRSDLECVARGAVCDRLRGFCVACRADRDCPSGQTCLGDRCARSRACTTHRDCPGQLCDAARGLCVDCASTVDCLSGGTCVNGGCVEAPSTCRSTRECTARGQVCDSARGVCVECVVDSDCGGELLCGSDRLCAGRVCVPGSRACVGATRVRVCDVHGTSQTETDCASGEGCVNGTCRLRVCVPRAMTCDDATTRSTCSDDGFTRTTQRCAAGERCEGGVCVSQSCVPLSVTCASSTARRVCDSTGSSSMVITCSGAPNATGRCDADSCLLQCDPHFADCDRSSFNGCEVDLRSVVANCGACGTVCPAPIGTAASCTNGVCSTACTSGRGDCDGDRGNGCEVALGSDVAHCGACNHNCSAGQTCNNGVCATAGWSSYFVAAGGAVTSALARDPTGLTVAGGDFYTTTTLNAPITSFGYGDAWLASYDATGAYRWVKRIGSTASENVRAIVIDGSGNVYAAGGLGAEVNFEGQVYRPIDTNGDIWVGSWTRDGATRWFRHFTGSGQASVSSLHLDATGTLWLSGNFTGAMSVGGQTITSAGLHDAWVARLRTGDGVTLNARALGGSREEYPSNIAVDPLGGAVIAVHSTSTNFDLGGGPLSNPGTVMPIVRLNESLAIVSHLLITNVPAQSAALCLAPNRVLALALRVNNGAAYAGQNLRGQNEDSTILALSPTGALLWQSSLDVIDTTGQGSSYIRSLTMSPEGTVWAVGQVGSSVWTFGTFRLNAGNFIATINMDGVPQRVEMPIVDRQVVLNTYPAAVSPGDGDVIVGGSFYHNTALFGTQLRSNSMNPAGFLIRALR